MSRPRVMASSGTTRSGQAARPWWCFGYLWLIIGIFAAAIAGGVATVHLAMQAPEAPGAGGAAQVQGQVQGQPADGALEPAMQARNRASSHNAKALGLGSEK